MYKESSKESSKSSLPTTLTTPEKSLDSVNLRACPHIYPGTEFLKEMARYKSGPYKSVREKVFDLACGIELDKWSNKPQGVKGYGMAFIKVHYGVGIRSLHPELQVEIVC